MDDSICAALYNLELDEFFYTRPYHKFKFLSEKKSKKELVQRIKCPHSFVFEDIPKNNIKLKHFNKSKKSEPIRKSISSVKRYSQKAQDVTKSLNLNLLLSNFQFFEKNIDSIKIRGTSAVLMKRKQNHLFKCDIKNYNKQQVGTIKVRIKHAIR